MTSMKLVVACAFALSVMSVACSEDPEHSADADAGTDAGAAVGGDDCDVIVSDDDCDETLRPIVFVHGTLGSGDNIAHVAQLFGSNGYCQDRFVAVDYNSLGGDPDAELDALIDKVLKDTGLDKVELLGHSQGAIHCYDYLAEPKRAAKVAHYVHLAGGKRDAPPSKDVPTISFSSKSDTILGAEGVTGADKTVVFEDQDHFAVASSTDTFVELYTYLMGKAPKYDEVQCGDEMVTIEAKARTFGDNGLTEGTLEIYELGTKDGAAWKRGTPLMVLESDGTTGDVAPFQLQRSVAYELRGLDAKGNVLGHQYLAPLKRSNRLVRFLSPSKNPFAAAATNSVKRNDAHSVLIVRYAKGALRQDLGDSLKVDGKEILSDEIANKSTSTVALFVFDDNLNRKSDGGLLAAYASTPFVKGTDVFIDASKPRFVKLQLNDSVLEVPNWPSDSEGMTLVTFP